MLVAYKYGVLQDGLMVVFERPMPKEAFDRSADDIILEVVQGRDNVFLRFGETHAVSLEPEILDALSRTKRLVLAVSDLFERKITIEQTVEFDDVMLGRLLAYAEIARKELAGTEESSASHRVQMASAAGPAPSVGASKAR